MRKTLFLFGLLAFLTLENNAQTTVTDVDGNVYNIVTIGTQVWMKENLKTTKYNDGTAIPLVENNTLWAYHTTPGYCWYNNDSASYKNTYGALYKWYAVSITTNGGKNICPANWHVPTHDEWTTLERTICTSGTCATDFPYDNSTTGGRGTDEGSKLRETGYVHWVSPNIGATNSSGFTALPGGYREYGADFGFIGSEARWWSATEYDSTCAWGRHLVTSFTTIFRSKYYYKYTGFSVRCVMDSTTPIKEINYDKNIQFYPNPAIDRLFINITDRQDSKMQVYSIIGECVYESVLTSGANMIDICSLKSGIYLVRLTGADWTIQRKLIKN